MPQSVTLYLPDDIAERYRRIAAVAGKHLDEFLVDRLTELPLPLADGLPESLRNDLRALEELDEPDLWRAAQGRLSDVRQNEYDQLLSKQSHEMLSMDEQKRLQELGQEAQRLTVCKAHAFMLLKWRGHHTPSREDLRTPE